MTIHPTRRRYLGSHKPTIAERKRSLDLNAGSNTVLGIVLVVGS